MTQKLLFMNQWRWLTEAQIELSQHYMWEKYQRRLVQLEFLAAPRHQNLLEHSVSCALMASDISSRIIGHSLVNEYAMVETWAKVHKIGEARLRTKLCSDGTPTHLTEKAWRDKTPADRVAEYYAFLEIINDLPPAVKQKNTSAFLLSLARFPEKDYREEPEDLRCKISDLSRYQTKAVRMAHFTEMYHFLVHPYEEYRVNNNEYFLTWVMRNVKPDLDAIASELPVLGENVWTEMHRTQAETWLKEHEWVPDEDPAGTSATLVMQHGNAI